MLIRAVHAQYLVVSKLAAAHKWRRKLRVSTMAKVDHLSKLTSDQQSTFSQSIPGKIEIVTFNNLQLGDH